MLPLIQLRPQRPDGDASVTADWQSPSCSFFCSFQREPQGYTHSLRPSQAPYPDADTDPDPFAYSQAPVAEASQCRESQAGEMVKNLS